VVVSGGSTGFGGAAFAYSDDEGATWSAFTKYPGASSSSFSSPPGIAYGNGIFVATATNVFETLGELWTSPDGVNWTKRSLPPGPFTGLHVSYHDPYFVVRGGDAANTPSVVGLTQDGVNYDVIYKFRPSAGSFQGATGGGPAILLYESGLYRSIDNGQNWAQIPSSQPGRYTLGPFFWDGTQYWAAGGVTGLFPPLYRSTDDGLTFDRYPVDNEGEDLGGTYNSIAVSGDWVFIGGTSKVVWLYKGTANFDNTQVPALWGGTNRSVTGLTIINNTLIGSANTTIFTADLSVVLPQQ
jgi:hypothetical protein